MMQEYTTNSGLFRVVNDANQQTRCKWTRRICQKKSKREKIPQKASCWAMFMNKRAFYGSGSVVESTHLLRGQSVRSFQGTSELKLPVKDNYSTEIIHAEWKWHMFRHMGFISTDALYPSPSIPCPVTKLEQRQRSNIRTCMLGREVWAPSRTGGGNTTYNTENQKAWHTLMRQTNIYGRQLSQPAGSWNSEAPY